MANTYENISALFTGIANAIRGVDGTEAAIVADTFPSRISHINDAATADADKILSGYTAFTGDGLIEGTIAAKTASDVTVSGPTVSVPAGFYGEAVEKTVASGSATTPATAITANPTLSVNYTTGVVTGSVSGSQSVTPTVVEGYVTAGTAGTVSVSGSDTLQLTLSTMTQGTTTVSGSTATRGELTWTQGLTQAGSLGAATFANVASSGVTYVDISATTDAPVLVTGDYLYINKGYTDNLKISLARLVPDGASADLASGVILSGYSAYNNDGQLIAGSIPTKTGTDLSASGATVIVPAGYYAQQYTKTIAAGSLDVSGVASASVTSLTPTYNSSTGVFDITGSASISGTATADVTAGYIDTDETGSITGTASVAASFAKIVGATAISGTATYKPVIAKTAAGNASAGTATTTQPASGHYIAVQSAANTGTITATPSVTTAGYGTAANHGLVGASETVGAQASDVTYIPITEGSATTPATAITAAPSLSLDPATGIVTGTVSVSESVTPTVVEGYVASGTAGTVSVSGSDTLQLTTKAAATYYPSASADQTITSGQFLVGAQTIKKVVIDADLIAANIKQGVVIEIGDVDDADRLLSVTGNYDSLMIAASY